MKNRYFPSGDMVWAPSLYFRVLILEERGVASVHTSFLYCDVQKSSLPPICRVKISVSPSAVSAGKYSASAVFTPLPRLVGVYFTGLLMAAIGKE